MASLTFARDTGLDRYREATERQATMPGVMRPSFRYTECGRSRATKGRKKTATGWRCAECHQAREYRKAIKGWKCADCKAKKKEAA